MSQRSPLARGFLKRCDLPGVFLFPLAARPSGAALCRLSATFAHPNAYPSMNYGAHCAGQLSTKTLFQFNYQFLVMQLVPVSGVDLPPKHWP